MGPMANWDELGDYIPDFYGSDKNFNLKVFDSLDLDDLFAQTAPELIVLHVSLQV